MNLTENIIVIPFTTLMYCREDLTYMLPGILHRVIEHKNEYFDYLINTSIYYWTGDKGAYLEKMAYYEHMADAVAHYLLSTRADNILRESMFTHYVDEVQITLTNDLFIKLIPKS